MESPMAGILAIAFVLLLSRRLGWNADPARTPLLLATILFACALFFPTIGAVEKETGWIVAGHVGTALGGIVVVVGILQFQRKGRTSETRPKPRKPQPKRTATEPPPAPKPHPNDPLAGPHDEQA